MFDQQLHKYLITQYGAKSRQIIDLIIKERLQWMFQRINRVDILKECQIPMKEEKTK
jgi:hypothetical protein